MGAKRGSKRAAASGGSSKKRGRPSKKQKDEEKQQEAKEKDTDEQQPTDAANNGDHKAAQPTDESKADNAEKTEAADAEEKATGQGEGVEYRAEPLEKGRLYFFYRPKVDAKEVRGTGDVQKFYILMSPEGTSGKPAKEEEVEGKRGEEREALKEGSEGGKKHRLLVVSSKMLPSHGRVRNPWSFIDAVGSLEEVEHKLERYSYDTKTRGHREIQPARLCGEARYDLIKTSHKNSVQTHVVYELEVPEQPSEVQQAFSIEKEGQFLINVKNPDFNCQLTTAAHWPPAVVSATALGIQVRIAKIPDHLMQHFQGKRQAEVRYCPVMTTEFLDLPHAELVMIGVKKGVKDETGDEFQRLVDELEEEVEAEEPKSSEAVFDELKMEEKEHPAAIEEFKRVAERGQSAV